MGVFSTTIYFLVNTGNFSVFHQIKNDDCCSFYTAASLMIFLQQYDRIQEQIDLGNDINKG